MALLLAPLPAELEPVGAEMIRDQFEAEADKVDFTCRTPDWHRWHPDGGYHHHKGILLPQPGAIAPWNINVAPWIINDYLVDPLPDGDFDDDH